jgi:hypothetical protein
VRRLSLVLLAYVLIAMVMTWPLMRHPGTRLASDLGDPAFNCWILQWTGGQVLAALSGNWHALAEYWNGNIFHPLPLTITYSEHLTPEMLQSLPIFAATGNAILTYNLLFLATFVLSGFAMYLLVRDLTGRPLAAFAAGLIYAYVPYRIDQLSHVQVLSSYWMPLALMGFRRFFATRSRLALAGGAASFVLQGLSCGYYLLFFAPFVAAYCLYEIVRRRLVRDTRVWVGLAAASVGVAIVLSPFVSAYMQVRRVEGVGTRAPGEITMFSADTQAFATAPEGSWLWGEHMRALPASEGQGFPGMTGLVFGAVALVAAGSRRLRTIDWRAMSGWRIALIGAAAIVFVWQGWIALVILAQGQIAFHTASSLEISRNIKLPLLSAATALVALIGLIKVGSGKSGESEESREFGKSAIFFFLSAVASVLLALGPVIRAGSHVIGPGPYALLLNYVPGFDGLRVPSRFFMLVAFFLSVLAGLGVSALLEMRPRWIGRAAVALACIGALADGLVVPFPIAKVQFSPPYLRAAEPATGRDINPLYKMVKQLPGQVVLLEMPIGDQSFDILAAFYAGYHRRPLINGYSGFTPPGYQDRALAIMGALVDSDAAARAIDASGATHVLVHESVFPGGLGDQLSQWLISRGAREVGADRGDRLFQLR